MSTCPSRFFINVKTVFTTTGSLITFSYLSINLVVIFLQISALIAWGKYVIICKNGYILKIYVIYYVFCNRVDKNY
jgi:hypothetical protein